MGNKTTRNVDYWFHICELCHYMTSDEIEFKDEIVFMCKRCRRHLMKKTKLIRVNNHKWLCDV